MNRFFKEKFIAFTLAEMMVILAIFSTIAAATLPVVTARRALDTSEMATGGSTIDPWTYSSTYNGISYSAAESALAGTAAVMVGGQVAADAYSLGYPQLIVRDVHDLKGYNFGNHIVFLKRNSNGNTYLGGSIMMGNRGEGSIAIGSNAMTDVAGNNVDKSRSVAIGSYSMYGRSSSGAHYLNSVAIGYANIYSSVSADNTVAIGYKNCAGNDGRDFSICIGNTSGGYFGSSSVAIGKNVGSNGGYRQNSTVAIGTSSLKFSNQYTGDYHVVLGYYAGHNIKGPHTVTIGYGAAGATNGEGQASVAIGTRAFAQAPYAVVIGRNATVKTNNVSCNESLYGATVIGDYAGYNFEYRNAPTLIGSYAGGTPVGASIAVNLAGTLYVGMSYPVMIGYRAGANEGGGPSPYLADVAIGTNAGLVGQGREIYNYGSTFIGNYAGYVSKAKRSVCIGNYTCASDSSESVVRIAPYGYYYVNSKALGEHISFIGKPTMIENFDSTTKEKFLGNSYYNMLITPAVVGSDLSTSSILFYADTVYARTNTFTSFSDKRLKENIRLAKYGLSDIRKINIYEYNLKGNNIKKRQIGVIAQELKEIIPEGVKQLPSGYYTVNADWLIFPMVNAIKELDKTIVSLKSDLMRYFKEYVVLVSKVNTLEKEVKTLERENQSLTKQVKVAYKKVKIAERRQ